MSAKKASTSSTKTAARPGAASAPATDLEARRRAKYRRLLEICQALPPTPTAVAHPCDESSL
jgi:hypothetical protein